MDMNARARATALLRQLDRDGKADGGAMWLARRHPQSAVMAFDDRSADRKSHAEALGFCCEEGFEDALRHGRVQSRTGVLDRNQHDAQVGETRGHDQLPRSLR